MSMFSLDRAAGDDTARLVHVPSSKPETQRALLIASLAEGTSRIYNDLRCQETDTMIAACENIGAKIRRHDGYAEVTGVGGRRTSARSPIIQASGSGLVFRTFAAIASAIEGITVITGDATLRNRVMSPLIASLRDLGAEISHIAEDGRAPIVVLGDRLEGGVTTVPGNISSQFITALLLAAPLARKPTTIRVTGTILSQSYIRQTLTAMRHAGAAVDCTDDFRTFRVEPGAYRAVDTVISGDYTSASYLLAATALFEGRYTLRNMSEESLQGERAIVDIVRRLGLQLAFDERDQTLTVVNGGRGVLKGDFHFDTSDCPNIIPTLAAIGAFVDGTFKVTGGSITRLHKSPRIQAMIAELTKLAVDIEPIFDGDVLDGFLIRGDGADPEGGVELSSWGDHRIFMSLYIATAKCRHGNRLPGGDSVVCSFPGFFDAFGALTNGTAPAAAELVSAT
ncbi:MAG TPA: 3-phosphoshikimate 1-carboxyvinyltransferase [Stellaceae bacterium]